MVLQYHSSKLHIIRTLGKQWMQNSMVYARNERAIYNESRNLDVLRSAFSWDPKKTTEGKVWWFNQVSYILSHLLFKKS